MRVILTILFVFLGVGLIKTFIECYLYSIPLGVKIIKNLVATIIDSLAMIVGLCLYPKIQRVLKGERYE